MQPATARSLAAPDAGRNYLGGTKGGGTNVQYCSGIIARLPTPPWCLKFTCITTAGWDLEGIHAAQSEHAASFVIAFEG